ncbi:MAG TPA: hypothetical protein ENN72_01945 [Firmicutes bacterium]|nr:hypothetical protein [Bacillota bacterium]
MYKTATFLCLIFLISVPFAVAQYIEPGHTHGDEDVLLDLSIIDAMEMDALSDNPEMEDVPDMPAADISGEMKISKYQRNFNIPFSYGRPVAFFGKAPQYLTAKVFFPVTSRSVKLLDGTKFKKTGLGDLTVGADYMRQFGSVLTVTGLYFKLPTGKMEVKDDEIPLGSGSFDVGLHLWARKKLSFMTLSGDLGYTVRGSYDSESLNNTYEYGNVFLLKVKGSKRLGESLYGHAALRYVSFGETKVQDNDGGLPYYFAGVKALDLIPYVTWHWKYNISLTGKLEIPLYSGWSLDKAQEPLSGDWPLEPVDPERYVKFSFKVTYPFSV